MKIVIDPGHGGHDSGFVFRGVVEKDLVLEYSNWIQEELVRLEHDVILTRNGDIFIGLSERAKRANELSADLLLSIHANASSNSEANGAWIIYDDASKPERGRRLAMGLFMELACIPGMVDEDPHVEVFADGTSWVGHRQLTVISKANMTAVLIELGFGTNLDDLSQLLSRANMGCVAAAVGRAVNKWKSQR